MVLSKINASINYPETKTINKDDVKQEVNLYQLEIADVDVIIALGNMQNKHEEENVLYYPIYLVKHNNKVFQIGVYEIESSKYEYYLDSYGNLDIDKLQEPLIYNFVTKDMLEKLRLKPTKETSKEEEDEDSDKEEEKEENKEKDEYEIPIERKDIFVLTSGFQAEPKLIEETKTVAKDINEKYKEDSDDNWMQKFMKNKYFIITDNEGGGDCFFATIRDAFSSIGQQTTVKKLREKLASETNEDIFLGYKEQYDMFHSSIASDSAKIKDLFAQYQNLKNKVQNVLDRNEKIQIVNMAKEVKINHERLIEEKKITTQMLSEYAFMKGIDSLDKFKKKIKTCEFWAETWAISTIERLLNIKFILMSEESYKNGDIKNVLQCGQMNDNVLTSRESFTPEFYIILAYTGYHYKLIGYKKKQIFTFNEISYSVKKLIVKKCLEKNSGIFSLIPEFKRFKSSLNGSGSGNESGNEKYEDLSESKLRGLYDEYNVFIFYNKSNNKPLPGNGSGEKVSTDYIKEFSKLASIPEWRKKLSTFWVNPFTLDNHRWSSVEHYYNACKFKKANPEFYLSFTIESGTELSKNPEMAKAAGNKSGKFENTLIRPKQVVIDDDYSEERQQKNIYDAQFAKFTQDMDLKQLLIETKRAKLLQFKSGKKPELDNNLMLVRDKIIKK